MLNLLLEKIKESVVSILPITIIVILLSFTPVFDLSIKEKMVFLVSSFILIVSMGVFNLGATLAMTPMGEFAGVGLLKMRNVFLLVVATFVMGFLVTIAEPDLMVLANQVKDVINPTTLIIFIGIGVGLFLVVAILKMLTHKSLSHILMIFYMLLFALVAIMFEINKSSFLPLAFDSGGVTTGPITVPFIMAFGMGIASTIGGKDSNENSFGMVSLSSVGPILVVLVLSMLSKGKIEYEMEVYSIDKVLYSVDALNIIAKVVIGKFVEVVKAISMIFVFFIILQIFVLKLPKTKMAQIIIGIFITLIGLVCFLSTVDIGFLPIGQTIGIQLAEKNRILVILFGFIIGMTVVLAEPAVHVLNAQVEEVTSGAIKRKPMMIALSIGVGLSIALSLYRVITGFSLLYYLVPGYFVSLALSLFVPPIYTSIAFDSGGVASGPMSSTFILPLIIGFCSAYSGDDKVLEFAFGAISLIAMTPLITIQLLGFNAVAKKYVQKKIVMNRILGSNDNQIIYFPLNY